MFSSVSVHLQLIYLCYNEILVRKDVKLMEIDLVCGMEVDPKTAEYSSIFQGKKYYFCSPGCKRDFDKEPNMYVQAVVPKNEHQHQLGHSD